MRRRLSRWSSFWRSSFRAFFHFRRKRGFSLWFEPMDFEQAEESPIERPFDDFAETPIESAFDSLRRDGVRLRRAARRLIVILRLLFFSSLIGTFSGVVGAAFQYAMRLSSEFFLNNETLGRATGSFRALFLLPLSGLAIVWLYKRARLSVDAGTNQVVESLTSEQNASLWLAPLIFVSSTITQMFGGSAGREGAALQLGGCVGLGTGRLFRLEGNELRIAIFCGMSGGFAAVFGAPLTATIFALEIACVGVVYYPAFLPALIAASIGALFTKSLGFAPFTYTLTKFPAPSVGLFLRVLLFGALCGLVCILFCSTIRRVSRSMTRRTPNDYARVVFGGLCVVVATLAIGTNAYNGTGLTNVQAALDGSARSYDFLFKIAFTALTLGAGFKGGEIVPALATGATFGCFAARFLGLDPTQGAALGLVALFCGATNCPLTALALSVEFFGAENAMFFAIVCGVGYMTSERLGLYRSQRVLFSKLTATPYDVSLRDMFQKEKKRR